MVLFNCLSPTSVLKKASPLGIEFHFCANARSIFPFKTIERGGTSGKIVNIVTSSDNLEPVNWIYKLVYLHTQ